MSKFKSNFLPDEKNRKLFPFFVAWLVGLGGGALVFVGSKFSLPILKQIGFVVGAGGVLILTALVVWQLIYVYPKQLENERQQNRGRKNQP